MENTLRIISGAISDRGLSEKRPENEDSYLELGQRGIYAVADGVGGAQAGEVASQMAVEIIGEAFTNIAPGADAEAVMRSAIEKANSAIHQMAQDLPQLSSMATTVVALHIDDTIATIGHVGDSRLYRVDRNGNFYRETDDHSMVAEEVRAGRMTEEQAENHPSRNIISRALGAEPTVNVDLKTIMIDGGTAILLCTDGITRHVTDQEIKGVLTFGGAPADICEYLKDLCYHRGAEDNLTAVVIKTSSANLGEAISPPADDIAAIHPTEPDEVTIATARTSPSLVQEDDDDILELNTAERLPEIDHGDLVRPAPPEELEPFPAEGIEAEQEGPERAEDSSRDTSEPEFQIEPPPPQDEVSELNFQRSNGSDLSLFDDSEAEEPQQGSLSKALSAAGLLILGAIIGIGAYYFAMAPPPVDTDGPRLSEMRSANIPLNAFEENRRNVDKDPANYIARFGVDPQDCEDFYLLGRAYLLTGDYARARQTLLEAKNRFPEADTANQAVLASDIALALAVTNDTTIQSILRKELESTGPAPAQGNGNLNTNSNTSP